MISLLLRYPISLLATIVALVVFIVPGANELLQLDFAAVGGGEFWRVFSGHWTHFDRSHLFWDLTMFAGLSACCERIAGKSYIGLLAMMAAAVSFGVATFCPQIGSYRGLSGLDTGLFCWLVVDRIGTAVRRGQWLWSGAGITLMLALLVKLVFECVTGRTLFVEAGDFQPLVQAHISGAIVGTLYGAASNFICNPLLIEVKSGSHRSQSRGLVAEV